MSGVPMEQHQPDLHVFPRVKPNEVQPQAREGVYGVYDNYAKTLKPKPLSVNLRACVDLNAGNI